MPIQKTLVALTGVNLLLLLGLLGAQAWPAIAQARVGILRGTGPEIVDATGRLRATITIQPESTANGETFSETVLFRLINADGQPSAKIGASATGAGLSFVGGDDQSYIILEAEGPESRLRMVEVGGGETVIEP